MAIGQPEVQSKQQPVCFGKLEIVFPPGEGGFRQTPDNCMACGLKTECLRCAIYSKEGIKVREEFVDKAYSSGKIGFFERWSEKKRLNHLKEARNGKTNG